MTLLRDFPSILVQHIDSGWLNPPTIITHPSFPLIFNCQLLTFIDVHADDAMVFVTFRQKSIDLLP